MPPPAAPPSPVAPPSVGPSGVAPAVAPPRVALPTVTPPVVPPSRFEPIVISPPAERVSPLAPPERVPIPHGERAETRAARHAPEPDEAQGSAVGRWVALAVAGTAVVAAVSVGVLYVWRRLPASPAERPVIERNVPAPSAPAPARAVTELRVKSTPDGARVLVDGKERGVTPLTLTGLAPGVHEVTIASNAGTVRRSVRLAANEATDVDESIFAGFVTVLAPFDVEVSENGHPLRTDERGQILLAPGNHDLRVANASLDYATVQQVEVKPGATTALRVTPPSSALTVTSAEPSEVWLDGVHVGDTPLNGVAAPLGTHEVVVKRAGATDRRFTVTIGTKPFTLNADSGR